MIYRDMTPDMKVYLCIDLALYNSSSVMCSIKSLEKIVNVLTVNIVLHVLFDENVFKATATS
jgi:hypothetical protein